VSRPDAGFDVDMNAVTIVGPAGAESLPLQPKSRLAAEILDRVERLLAAGPADRTRPEHVRLTGHDRNTSG
jgi:hypothetical protein